MTTPRMTSTTPVARLSVLGEALLANTAQCRAQTSVKSTQSANTVQSGAPPMAKCETAPVSAVKAVMKTLVPIYGLSS